MTDRASSNNSLSAKPLPPLPDDPTAARPFDAFRNWSPSQLSLGSQVQRVDTSRPLEASRLLQGSSSTLRTVRRRWSAFGLNRKKASVQDGQDMQRIVGSRTVSTSAKKKLRRFFTIFTPQHPKSVGTSHSPLFQQQQIELLPTSEEPDLTHSLLVPVVLGGNTNSEQSVSSELPVGRGDSGYLNYDKRSSRLTILMDLAKYNDPDELSLRDANKRHSRPELQHEHTSVSELDKQLTNTDIEDALNTVCSNLRSQGLDEETIDALRPAIARGLRKEEIDNGQILSPAGRLEKLFIAQSPG